ncbi:hypothetical protein GCM10023189_20050 [Nibrella saemangeumensis]|uniref:Secreted protein n=1 Tax=Nibrella saemangeumensis TaxID=1084526 RepID=A0ABP8MSE4_9BACT
MKKILSTLCLTTMVSFALLSCQKDGDAGSLMGVTPKDQSNARGGPPAKVQLCHTEPDGTTYTIEVPEPAVAGHLKHGDVMGPCPTTPVTPN